MLLTSLHLPGSLLLCSADEFEIVIIPESPLLKMFPCNAVVANASIFLAYDIFV
jgi:hypothetical protein